MLQTYTFYNVTRNEPAVMPNKVYDLEKMEIPDILIVFNHIRKANNWSPNDVMVANGNHGTIIEVNGNQVAMKSSQEREIPGGFVSRQTFFEEIVPKSSYYAYYR